ncbi:hypothetical protein LCGC14_1479710, partial [marine sediment metagenome]
FIDLEGLTREGLSDVAGEWEFFYGELDRYFEDFVSAKEQRLDSLIGKLTDFRYDLEEYEEERLADIEERKENQRTPSRPQPIPRPSPRSTTGPTSQAPTQSSESYEIARRNADRIAIYNRQRQERLRELRAGDVTGYYGVGQVDLRNVGQAGQVSALLADALSRGRPAITIPSQLPARLPAVPPSRSVDRREIHVTADLLGVDPYMQEVVINTMLEIERNRGV